MQTTARQYGQRMREANILWPAPIVGKADRKLPGVTIYKIGKRSVEDVFVLERKGFGTVYASPAYGGYREAFDQAMPNTSFGMHVDHLFPKSKASGSDFIALGRLTAAVNRQASDRNDEDSLALKAVRQTLETIRNYPIGVLKAKPVDMFFTSRLTDYQRGWAAVNCYIRPMEELKRHNLTKVESAL